MCIVFESSVKDLTETKKHRFTVIAEATSCSKIQSSSKLKSIFCIFTCWPHNTQNMESLYFVCVKSIKNLCTNWLLSKTKRKQSLFTWSYKKIHKAWHCWRKLIHSLNYSFSDFKFDFCSCSNVYPWRTWLKYFFD